MLLVFIILIIVTVCVTIVGTYFLLNAENYHWRWTSFFSAASTALYVYLYAIYYYHVKTKMSGFFQTSFYFGYTMMFCLGLGILCGKLLYANTGFVECLIFSFPSKSRPCHGLNWFFLDFFVTPGAVGYLGSNLFVRRIYRNIKCD